MAGPLASAVRAKYPGSYDHVSDEDLERAIVAKYPGSYDHLIEAPEVSSQLAGPPEQTLGRVASTTWDTIKGGAESMARLSGIPGMITGGPWNAVKQQASEVWKMSQAHGDQYLKAKAAEREGRILPMIGHSVAAAIPVIGPWAASIGETAGSGDLAGAAGIGIGGVALAEAPTPVARGVTAMGRPVVRGVQRAAAGASEGGVGGAVANVLRSAAPLPPKLMVTQALKPRSSLLGFDKAMDRALPELKITEAELGRPIATLADTLEAIPLAKKRVRAQYDEIAGPRREMGSTVDFEPVADAMVASIPKKVRLESPEVAAAMEQRAEAYRGRFDLAEAERLLLETNAELDSYYGKFPAAQRHGVAANPETAALVSQAKEMRTAIYRSLDDPGQGAAPRELNRRYGALLELEGEAQRRVNVQARQPSENLAEQISGARAVGHVVKGGYRLLRGDPMGAIDIASGNAMRSASKFMKEQQTTDALLRRAFASYEGAPVPVEMPSRRVIRGALPPATIRLGGASDTSYVRGEPATVAIPDRKALPPGRPPRPMGPSPDSSGPIPPTLPENLTRPVASPAPMPAAVEAAPVVAEPVPVAPKPESAVQRQAQAMTTRKPTVRRVIEAKAESPSGKPQTYIRGDRAEYTGETQDVAGATFYKAQMKEGHRTGEVVLTRNPPKSSPPDTSPAATPAEVRQVRETVSRTPDPDYVPPPKVEPATVTPITQPKSPIKVDTPASASAQVVKHARQVDLKGAKSGAAVQLKVIEALQREIPAAQEAVGYGELSYNRQKAYGGREGSVFVDGEPVASIDRYGNMKWESTGVDEKGRSYTDPDLPKLNNAGRDLNAAQHKQHALKEVATALGRKKGAGLLELQIPGDGTFTIERNPHVIRETINRVMKEGKGVWEGLTGDKPKYKTPNYLKETTW